MEQKELAEYDKLKYSLKNMWWLGKKVASATFIIAGIYFQFREIQKA